MIKTIMFLSQNKGHAMMLKNEYRVQNIKRKMKAFSGLTLRR